MTVLHTAVRTEIARALSAMGCEGLPVSFLPCPDPSMGDAGTGLAMQAARVLRRAPAAIASDLADFVRALPCVRSCNVASPGFLNFAFSDAAVATALEVQAADPRCGIRQADRAQTVVLDYGGPNVAKRMHVGHLRSLVIGESLRRILAVTGHRTVSDVHFGDWGLPAGMILDAISASEGLPSPDDLKSLYPRATAACSADPARMAAARAATAALQGGDPELGATWSKIVDDAKSEACSVFTRLGAHFDLMLGESDAHADVPAVLDAFEASGLLRREGAAFLVDLATDEDKHPVPPLVLGKEDGSSLYATTDLATIVGRKRDLSPDRIVYIVDGRQSLHFLQVFRAAGMAGLVGGVSLEHAAFGTVNGPDGKPFRTRAGNTAGLVEVLDMARDAALQRLVSGSRMADATDIEILDSADAIGLAALRVADLSSNRVAGYTLDLDRATSFEGHTGPYLLYNVVRMRNILARAAVSPGQVALGAPEERALALECLGLGDAVGRAAASMAPAEIVHWSFGLASAFSRFYAACPVLAAESTALAASRLTLCLAAEKSLSSALDLLGCRVPPAM